MSFGIPHLTEITLDDLGALGTDAGILGTGGSGNPCLGRLRLQAFLEDDAYPDSVEPVNPRDLPPDATVASVGGMGTPIISVEKFVGGGEEVQSLRAIEELFDKMVDALIPGEVGGANSMAPLCVAVITDLPVVDADGMGRTFPEPQMDAFFIYGTSVNYAATTDERGNQAVCQDVGLVKRFEDLTRAIAVRMGGRSGYASPLMTDASVSEYVAPHIVLLATKLGRAVEHARGAGTNLIDVDRELLDGEELFARKIVDVYRRNRNGLALGSVIFVGSDEDVTLEIELRNELLVARDDDGNFRTTVPDLICLVNTGADAPATTDTLRYGQHVRVFGVSAPELLTTPEALDVIGPEAFGYEVPYDPLLWDETG